MTHRCGDFKGSLFFPFIQIDDTSFPSTHTPQQTRNPVGSTRAGHKLYGRRAFKDSLPFELCDAPHYTNQWLTSNPPTLDFTHPAKNFLLGLFPYRAGI